MDKQIDRGSLSEDVYGNNAAVTCPICGKVYIVSAMINKRGRNCPQCGNSKAIFRNNDGRKIATISWTA